MNLIELFGLLESGKITEAEAAESLGLTETSFKTRRTRWGHRLPLLLSVLDKRKSNLITRAEASEILAVTPREVNKLEASWKIVKDIKPYLLQRAASKVKWEIHKKHAIDFISGSSSLEEASERSGIDDRSMRRWVAKLINEHEQMTWKDLKATPLKTRRQVAMRIEEAEDLNFDKQNVINAIARGDKTLQEVANERVEAKIERLKGVANIRARHVRGIGKTSN